jgi:hypothetical protein
MGTNRQRGPIARRADEPQDLVRRLSGIARTQRKGKDESRRRPVRRNGIAKLCWRPPAGPRSARPSRNATAPKRRRSTTRSRRGGRRLVENTPCRRGRRPACADSGHHRQSGQDTQHHPNPTSRRTMEGRKRSAYSTTSVVTRRASPAPVVRIVPGVTPERQGRRVARRRRRASALRSVRSAGRRG